MPLNVRLISLLLATAVPLVGTAAHAVDIRNFAPPSPSIDYSKLCIAETDATPPSDKPHAALKPKEKFLRARALFLGTDIVIPDPTRSAKLLEDVIKSGTPELQAAAKNYLSLLLISGNGVTRDEPRALKLLEEALPYDPASNAFALADYYDRHKQFETAETYYKRAGAAGHARAYLKLAFLYREGLVPAPSPTTAEEMIATSQNMMLEQLMDGKCGILRDIASLFLTNKYRIRNDKLAMQWLREGDKADVTLSQLLLASAYETGFRGEKNIPEALRIWRKVAAKGQREAMFRLGKNLILSPDHAYDEEAIHWLSEAAKRNYSLAFDTLISYYRGEYGHKPDAAKAAEWLEKSLVNPKVEALNIFRLAQAYATGQGVEKDEAKAFTLYERASAAGSADALYELGEAYLYGRGVERNPIKSYRFYRLAASERSNDSVMALIRNYDCGIAKAANPKQAEIWRQRGIYEGISNLMAVEATRLLNDVDPKQQSQGVFLLARWVKQEVAKRNRLEAVDSAHLPMVMLSAAFTKGLGVPKDSERAALWQKRATANPRTEAAGMVALGKAYLDPAALGIHAEKARALFSKAAALESDAANLALGMLYLNGAKGIEADVRQAENYLRQSALQNNITAARQLGKILLVSADPARQKEGLDWLAQAAERGDIDSSLKLGSYALRNHSVPKERAKAEALHWLKVAESFYPCTPQTRKKLSQLQIKIQGERSLEQLQADAAKGDTSAMRKLAAHALFAEQTADAITWYKKAANAGDAQAMLELGNLYYLGTGIEASATQAKQWWQKAADAGSTEAAELVKD